MGEFLYSILKTARPRQWLKNIALFTTIFFTGQLFDQKLFLSSFLGFIAFCFLASSNYFINDILDAPSDKKHPFKKFRPIASGKLSITNAVIASMMFLILGLSISYKLGLNFLLLSTLFISLQYMYSLYLKKISVIDILVITAGYFIRVYAGEAATGYHISVWVGLAALSLALFLAIGKRRAELTLIQRYKGVIPQDTRITLTGYSEKLLDTYTAMFANSTFITYALYTFLERPVGKGFLFHNYSKFIDVMVSRKWLMTSIPFVLYGIMRYMQLIYEGKGESPEKVLTSDLPLLSTVVLWGATVFLIIYGIGG
ncbi:UbiA prenyltransferase family protein [Patescibacteria group bacterium]